MLQPRFLTQTKIHDPPHQMGNCLATCIAMLIGITPDEFPHRYLEVPVEEWWDVLREDLRDFDWDILYVPDIDLVQPRGWHIINGPSPRGFPHSCLGYVGAMIWDPHPSRDGLVEVESYYILQPIES